MVWWRVRWGKSAWVLLRPSRLRGGWSNCRRESALSGCIPAPARRQQLKPKSTEFMVREQCGADRDDSVTYRALPPFGLRRFRRSQVPRFLHHLTCSVRLHRLPVTRCAASVTYGYRRSTLEPGPADARPGGRWSVVGGRWTAARERGDPGDLDDSGDPGDPSDPVHSATQCARDPVPGRPARLPPAALLRRGRPRPPAHRSETCGTDLLTCHLNRFSFAAQQIKSV